MTEAEWLGAKDYLALLIYLRGQVNVEANVLGVQSGLHCSAGFLAAGDAGRVSRRKLRLFAAAICRKWWEIPHDDLGRKLLKAYERFVNNDGAWDDFIAVGMEVQDAVQRREQPSISHMAMMWNDTPFGVANMANDLAVAIAGDVAKESTAAIYDKASEDDLFAWSFFGGPPDPLWQSTRNAMAAEYAPISAKIVGNPFRPVAVDPSWLTSTVVALAECIYTEKAFDRMPVLADALQDAGCHNEDILTHCRSEGVHVKGCWLVDLLTGRK